MPASSNHIIELLDKLYAHNIDSRKKASKIFGEDLLDLLKQTIEPPDRSAHKGIPTLKRDVFRMMTPMLKARFDYASRWENALNGLSLLSLKEMESVWEDEEMMTAVQVRAEYWEDSPPNRHPWDCISLFAYDPDGQGECYLAWPSQEGEELSVVSISSQVMREFTDLEDLIRFYLEEDPTLD